MLKYHTSFHTLNSDTGLDKLKKFLWLLYNFLNNLYPNHYLDKNLKISSTQSEVTNYINQKEKAMESPSRKLCNYFWDSLNWKYILKALNNHVSAIEIGCGNGVYGKRINGLLGINLQSYIGIDPGLPQTRYNNLKFMYYNDDSNNVNKYLNGTNFIFTQSAIEHFENDLLFFKQIADYTNRSNQPIVQIHLMPTAACLFTYLLHGIRQYTPRTISKITRLFPDSKIILYSLGSINCIRVHQKFITIPLLFNNTDRRITENSKYKQELSRAIEVDNRCNRTSPACFYALVICSNTKGKIDNKILRSI